MTIVITKQQFDSRWDALPEILREALVSGANSDIIRKTAEAEHLPEEKASIISGLTGSVLMGFIHPEDLAQEIKEDLGINQQIAQSIADKLNSRIFAPLRNELEKVYAPAAAEPAEAAPRIVEEIKKVSAEPAPEIIPVEPEVAGAQPAQPTPPAPLEIKQVELKPEVSAPAPPKPMEQQAAEPGPAPLILHKEAESRPLKPSPEFRLEFADKFREASAAKPSAKPAFLEIGPESETKVQPKKVRTEVPEPRVVHYSGFRTPLEKPEQPKAAVPQPEPAPAKTPLPEPEKTIEAAKPISPAAPIQPSTPALQPPSAPQPAPPQPPAKPPEEKIIDLSSL